MPTTLMPTFDTGATARPGEVVRVDPRRSRDGDELAPALAAEGLNAPFIADILSAMLTHERCGRHLYRSVAGRTNNPMLKRKYEQFGNETEHHVEVLERLIVAGGGDPQYVSPAARAVEGTNTHLLQSTFLLSGSVDVMTQEMVMLDAVLMAEAMDHANWGTLTEMVPTLPEGPIRDAFLAAAQEVDADEDNHLAWARSTKTQMTLLQAQSSTMAKAGAVAEEMVERVKGWFA